MQELDLSSARFCTQAEQQYTWHHALKSVPLLPPHLNLLTKTHKQAKAEAAIATITSSSPSRQTDGQLKFLHLDLNDLLSVKRAAATFASQESKLDILWNNAGQGPKSVKAGQKTVQGFEPMIGMHCVATLLFTELLLPQLRAAAAEGIKGRTRVV